MQSSNLLDSMKPLKSIYTEAAVASVRITEDSKDSVWKLSQIPSVLSVMTANVILMKTSFLLKHASHRRINLSAVAEVFAFVGNVYVTKPSLEECMASTVRRMISPVPISMGMCVLGMGSVKVADASALMAGKGIGVSVRQPLHSTVSTPRAKFAAGEAPVCVVDVSAPIQEALAAFVSTAQPAISPAVKTGIVCSAFTLTICLRLSLISVKPPVLSWNSSAWTKHQSVYLAQAICEYFSSYS